MLLQLTEGSDANNLVWNNYDFEGGNYILSKFYIYRGSSQSNLQIIDTIGENSNTYTDHNPPNEILYYQIAGVKPDACIVTTKKKSMSDENYNLVFTNIVDNGLTDFSEINYSHFIKIYPNPFSNKTTIEFPNPEFEPYKLIITNISGTRVKIIDTINTGKIELEKGTLQKGIYLIEIKGKKIYKGRIIIE